jgi:hypothetical protein
MTNNDFNVNRSFLAEKAKRKRVINPDECKFDLGDDIYKLFKGFKEALPLYQKELGMTAPEDRVRTQAAVILQSKVMQCWRKQFGERVKRGKYARLLLYIKGYVVLFKKLDRNGMPMNIKTVNATSIENQYQGNLFGPDEDGNSPILVFGYTTNDFGVIVHPRIIYIDEGKVKWTIDEEGIKDNTIPELDFVPTQPTGGVSVKKGVKPLVKKAE